MITIYADVLIALNLYITWFLLLAAERLAGSRTPRWRRGLAALAGGIASLAILLPELPFPLLFLEKLGTAAVITWIAYGAGGWKRFFKQMGLFFCVSFLFAGCMAALWVTAAPPRLIVRNGTVYYHIPAMTLAVSTILAYGAVRVFAFFRDRMTPGHLLYRAEICLNGKQAVCNVFLDTGNRVKGPGGLPVIFCQRELLMRLLPGAVLEAMESPEKAADLGGTEWGTRMRFFSCGTVGGTRLVCGVEAESFQPEGGEKVPCILALAEGNLSDGEYQAVSGILDGGQQLSGIRERKGLYHV